MPDNKRPNALDNEITSINGGEYLVVDNGTLVGKMLISRIKSILTKADVGLSNSDNTSDINKPISSDTQTALNGKAATFHGHSIADVTGLDTTLALKADNGHVHAISDVTNLVDALASKAGVDHLHDFNDITGLAGAVTTEVEALVPDLVIAAVGDQLADKADAVHTHVSTDITDLNSVLSDAISSAIPNISAANIQNSMYVAELQW